MGKIHTRKIIILIILLLLVTFLTYYQPEKRIEEKAEKLSNAISKIDGWELVNHIKLEERVIESLSLDDYAYMIFSNGENIITLYIGYYFDSSKLGAAHDPLVCFPGQGWKITDIHRKEALVDANDGTHLKYSIMTAEKNQQEELIIYWFQAYEETNSSTFLQKISAFKNRIQSKGGDNAFVRINTTLNGITVESAEKTTLEFIQAFYPVFIKYVSG